MNVLTSIENTLLTPVIPADQMMQAHTAAREWIKAALVPKTDYSILPGTDKHILLKPGIDKILIGFGLTPKIEFTESTVDLNAKTEIEVIKWIDSANTDPAKGLTGNAAKLARDAAKERGEGRNKKYGDNWVWQRKEVEKVISNGLYRYVAKCTLYDRNGVPVGEGSGICSSLEAKYIRAPHDAEHTIQAMAAKRARSAAAIATLGLSDMFGDDDAEGPITVTAAPKAMTPRDEAKAIFREFGASEQDEASWYNIWKNSGGGSEAIIRAKKDGCASMHEAWDWMSSHPPTPQSQGEQLPPEASPEPEVIEAEFEDQGEAGSTSGIAHAGSANSIGSEKNMSSSSTAESEEASPFDSSPEEIMAELTIAFGEDRAKWLESKGIAAGAYDLIKRGLTDQKVQFVYMKHSDDDGEAILQALTVETAKKGGKK